MTSLIQHAGQILIPEYHPWFILKHATNGDAGFWLSWLRATAPHNQALVCRPGELSNNELTGLEHKQVADLIKGYFATNLRLIKDVVLAPFPKGDRVAVVGSGQASARWDKNESLGIEDEPDWEPNVTIYLNFASGKRRKRSGPNHQNWQAIIDRVFTPAMLGDAVNDIDGFILSLGVNPELMTFALNSGKPVHITTPERFPETDGRYGISHVSHGLSVSVSTLGCLGLPGQRPRSLLVIGVDGVIELPKDPPPSAADIANRNNYIDIGIAAAGMTIYLEELGIKVHRIALNRSPYMTAVQGAAAWRHRLARLQRLEREDAERAKHPQKGGFR